MSPFKNHFSTRNAQYAMHRPIYPHTLVDVLADAAPGRELVLDVGCGTGQLSTLLATRFTRVVATDASAGQIASATPHERVAYHTAPAECSGLPNGSADLVTVAQAAHRLDLELFYAEVRRIARPGAVVALITYGVLHVEEASADAVVQRFYYDLIGPYRPAERKHVEDGYRGLPFPFASIHVPALDIEVAWKLGDLIGYTDTWSAVRAAEKAIGRAPVEAFQNELAEAWGDCETVRRVRWPLSLRVGRINGH